VIGARVIGAERSTHDHAQRFIEWQSSPKVNELRLAPANRDSRRQGSMPMAERN
jgi:hypothetical protein